MRLQTTPAAARVVAESAARLACVSFAALTSGRFNVVTLITATDREELADRIHREFRCWKAVHKIGTVEFASTVKHRLDMVRIGRSDE